MDNKERHDNTDIVFVNPPLSMEDRYGKLAVGGDKTAPLGLCYMAASLRIEGYNVKIIDAEALGLNSDQVVNKILDIQPKYIGITAVTISIINASLLATKLKASLSSVPIILGGPHITAAPHETMKRYNQFDIGVLGEGERTVVELIKALNSGAELIVVPGLIVRHKGRLSDIPTKTLNYQTDDSKILKKYIVGEQERRFIDNSPTDDGLLITPPRLLIQDLDELPMPAWDLLDGFPDMYTPNVHTFGRTPVASLLTSRGCYAQCTFCDRSVFGRKMRPHGPDYVINMINHLVKTYGIKELEIHDDVFLAFKKRARDICTRIINEKIDITWTIASRVGQGWADMMQLISDAGCWQVAYGFETGSQRILDSMQKDETIEQAKKAIVNTKAAGMRVRGFFMIGNPNETIEDIEKTINFVLSNEIDDFHMTFFTPLPGSEIYENYHEYGTLDDDWSKMNLWQPIFIPHGITKKELIKYQKKAFWKFYFRLKTIYNYFIGVKSLGHFLNLAKAAIGVFRM